MRENRENLSMNIRLNLKEICESAGGKIVGGENIIISANEITTDSRKAAKGSLFVAIKGENLDGHDFVGGAFENGAAVAVISEEHYRKQPTLTDTDRAFIIVGDTIQAMLDAAKLCKSKITPPLSVIGVTGSVGKTTTKEFIYSVISQKYITQKSAGNFNTEVGLPLTMFALDDKTQVLVQEMGMNNLGEIDKLSRTAEPDVAVITNIGTSHIEMLGSRENICRAKLEILNGMGKDASVILNADEPLLYSKRGETGRKEMFFGIENRQADILAEDIKVDYSRNLTEFEVVFSDGNERARMSVPSVGRHNVYNALAAFAVGRVYGLDVEEIQTGFNSFESGKMRQNIYSFRDITIIDDCYNASLESASASLEVLRGIAKESGGRSVAVMSDVLEAGSYSDDIHFKIGIAAAEKNTDIVFVCGEKSKMICEGIKSCGESKCKYYYFGDKKEMAERLCAEVKKGDVVLFKASRGMKLEETLNIFKEAYNI